MITFVCRGNRPCTLDDFLGLVRASTASGAFTPVMLGWISEILNG